MKILLRFGIAAPVLYFATMIVSALSWPGYSHRTQYVSELGSAAAPHPALFNWGILVTGTAGVMAGLGVALFFARQRRPWSGGFAGAALVAWGIGMLFGGFFPMPDPRHNGYGLVMGIALAAPLLGVALRGRRNSAMNLFLSIWFVATAALLAIMFGVGGLVTRANVGLWQRALALAMIPGIGIACAALLRSLRLAPER